MRCRHGIVARWSAVDEYLRSESVRWAEKNLLFVGDLNFALLAKNNADGLACVMKIFQLIGQNGVQIWHAHAMVHIFPIGYTYHLIRIA